MVEPTLNFLAAYAYITCDFSWRPDCSQGML